MGQVTIGPDTFDIYGTEAGAKTYFRARLGSDDWDDASGNDRKKALVGGTRWLDSLVYQGAKTVASQPLLHPRTELVDCDGQAVPSGSVAVQMEEACYELALVLLGDAEAFEAADTGSNVKRAKADVAEVEFFKPTAGNRRLATPIPQSAWRLIRCFVDDGGTGIHVSGAEGESGFCDFGLSEGFA